MKPLRRVLIANLLSNVGFGFLFVIWPKSVAALLGAAPEGLVFGIGIVLLLNGAAMGWVVTRPRLQMRDVLGFSIGDLGWWLFSMWVIASGLWVTTPQGIAATWIVAIGVAGMGVGQLYFIGMERYGDGPAGPHRRFVASWLALPLWVKIWLFFLNAVFLAVFVALEPEPRHIVLTGFVASVPLLLAFAYPLGGLNRLVGLGHLVPWVPMLVWLVLAWPTPGAYTAILAGTMAICLGFDVYDVIRWSRGDRAVMGARPD